MKELLEKVRDLQHSPVADTVNQRLEEFRENNREDSWFSELCFCILTANSQAKTALKIQDELGLKGFCQACEDDVKACIRSYGHRFHNNKTDYIMQARENIDIKEKIKDMDSQDAREWIVKNIKGIAYKEASHFLRNIGRLDVAIVDRHIINILAEHDIIKKPKYLKKKTYMKIEKVLKEMAQEVDMQLGELDLYLWYLKTGEILK